MVPTDRFRAIELFGGLREEQLAWLAGEAVPVELADGEVLFEDGQAAEHFYVLLSGELLITKLLDGREQVVGRHSAEAGTNRDAPPPGDGKPRAAHQFTGELPLLAGGGYVAKATAVGRTTLAGYDKDTFLLMLVRCPEICQVLLPVLAWRIHSYEAQAGRRSLLAGLGTMAAGLAHELNNPAAAVVRTADELLTTVHRLTDSAVRWGRLAEPAERQALERARESVPLGEWRTRPDDALAAAEAADAVADWLVDRELAGVDELAPILADHGITSAWLDSLAERLRPEVVGAALSCVAFSACAASMAQEVAEAGRRISALVGSVSAYSDLDRAPEREVDLVEGIEATLVMLAPKLAGIKIRREYAELPRVTAYQGELNQVWTNLVDNAADALAGRGELRITTRLEGECVVVEIRDNGPGVPAHVLPNLFQPFFTTKDIGRGTGLGLHLSHEIMTMRHNGSITVTSVPGDTRFTVRLPATLS